MISAYQTVRSRIPAQVKLVAVSKTYFAPDIQPVLDAGQRMFGENRVQEANEKWPELRAIYQDVELHLIGPLQSNKAAEAVALFDVIQTVDRLKIAETLAKEAQKQGWNDEQMGQYLENLSWPSTNSRVRLLNDEIAKQGG